jgi:hypothetical protein
MKTAVIKTAAMKLGATKLAIPGSAVVLSLALMGTLALGVAAPRLALAHHSGSEYDFRRMDKLQGVVKDVRVINPHMTMTLVVTDAHGMRTIAFEGQSVNTFYRAGWRPHMINVGDHISVEFAPRKNGADGGFINGFTTAGGVTIAFKVPTSNPVANGGAG